MITDSSQNKTATTMKTNHPKTIKKKEHTINNQIPQPMPQSNLRVEQGSM